MTVNAVRITGNQGQEISAFFNLELFGFVRLHDLPVADLICEFLIENINVDDIVRFKLVYIIKELLRRIAAVRRNAGAGISAANRKRCFLQMRRAFFQNVLAFSVIDWQSDMDRWDFNRSHNTAVNIENIKVFIQNGFVFFGFFAEIIRSNYPVVLCRFAQLCLYLRI